MLSHYLIKTVNIVLFCQLFVALPIYFKAALSPGQEDGDPLSFFGLVIDTLTLHFIGNLLLSLALNLALYKWVNLKIRIAICLLFATVAELGQILIPSRQFDVIDLIVNYAGLLAGFALFAVLDRLRNRISLSREPNRL